MEGDGTEHFSFESDVLKSSHRHEIGNHFCGDKVFGRVWQILVCIIRSGEKPAKYGDGCVQVNPDERRKFFYSWMALPFLAHLLLCESID